MQKPTVPPYKPSKEVQQLIYENLKESQKRRHSAVIPKRSWVQRNPRTFQITFITTSLLIFFSKPIYDAFLAPEPTVPTERVPVHKR